MSRLFISPFRSLSTTSSILSPLQEAVSAVTVAGSTVELLAPLHSPSGMVATIVLLLEAIAARLIAPEAVAMPTSKLSCRSLKKNLLDANIPQQCKNRGQIGAGCQSIS
uniref:(northern house mosquito) hypothetical protein n=1 Tax=Culex pipiens TaxID=7175 RepID=A0A8D8C2B6_CULPI